jgi:hypothetical protein
VKGDEFENSTQNSSLFTHHFLFCTRGPVDKASPSEGEDRTFESCRVHASNQEFQIGTALVAQWIEQTSPKGKIGVRFPVRASLSHIPFPDQSTLIAHLRVTFHR